MSLSTDLLADLTGQFLQQLLLAVWLAPFVIKPSLAESSCCLLDIQQCCLLCYAVMSCFLAIMFILLCC